MKHRPEIDGLRAVAILPVILLHAGYVRISGGFLGVDIFFVISGYLITGIILRELAQGSFSIRRFYERRARRILPALLVVLLVSMVCALAWLLPHRIKPFAESALAALSFTSNFYFWADHELFLAFRG